MMFHSTVDNASRRSRIGRAHFLLWFSSSFIWVGVFFLILILLRIQIGKPLYLPIFLSVFALNYFLLYRTYIKTDRGKMVLETEKDITRGRVLFARFFIILSMFLSIAIMLAIAVYYGKNIGYL